MSDKLYTYQADIRMRESLEYFVVTVQAKDIWKAEKMVEAQYGKENVFIPPRLVE